MTSERRVTILDIAKLAGVSHTTVSRALHRHPSISVKTRRRIEVLASKLNYRPDPVLSSLMVYRQQVMGRQIHAGLAFFRDIPGVPSRRGSIYTHIFTSASVRAKELGYHLDTIWMNEPGLTPKRLSTILKTRNIRGVLVSALISQDQSEINFNLDGIAAVTLGLTVRTPMHRVCDDYFFSINETCVQLSRRGYVRPALYMSRFLHERNQQRWVAAFMINQLSRPVRTRGIVGLDNSDRSQLSPTAFKDWWNSLKHKPDSVIFVDAAQANWYLEQLDEPLRSQLGVTILYKTDPSVKYAGIMVDNNYVGRLSINFLVGLVQDCDLGIPQNPQTIHLQGTWSEGRSLRGCQ